MFRPGLDPSAGEESLFDALIAARARFGDKEILEDQDRKPLTYTGLIRAAFVLGRKIAAMTQPAERVGILLPSSMGVVVTFFGLHAFGRVPVMLNFTSGQRNLKAAIDAAGVRKILCARRFVEQAKLEDLIAQLGAIAEIVWLDDVRESIGLQDKLFGLMAGLMPKRFRVTVQPDDPGPSSSWSASVSRASVTPSLPPSARIRKTRARCWTRACGATPATPTISATPASGGGCG